VQHSRGKGTGVSQRGGGHHQYQITVVNLQLLLKATMSADSVHKHPLTHSPLPVIRERSFLQLTKAMQPAAAMCLWHDAGGNPRRLWRVTCSLTHLLR